MIKDVQNTLENKSVFVYKSPNNTKNRFKNSLLDAMSKYKSKTDTEKETTSFKSMIQGSVNQLEGSDKYLLYPGFRGNANYIPDYKKLSVTPTIIKVRGEPTYVILKVEKYRKTEYKQKDSSTLKSLKKISTNGSSRPENINKSNSSATSRKNSSKIQKIPRSPRNKGISFQNASPGLKNSKLFSQQMEDEFSNPFNIRGRIDSVDPGEEEDKFNFVYDEVSLGLTAKIFEAEKPFENRTEVASSLWHMN